MGYVVRTALELGAKCEEVAIREDGVHCRIRERTTRHTSIDPRVKKWIVAARIRECWMHLGILVPVPVWKTEIGFSCQLLADLLKVQKIRAVPGKKVICAMMTEVEA